MVGTVLLTWAVLVGLDAVLAMANEIDSIGDGDYGFFSAVNLHRAHPPRRAYMMFPTAAVIGALMGLGQLAASSELTAPVCARPSRKRLSASVGAAVAGARDRAGMECSTPRTPRRGRSATPT